MKNSVLRETRQAFLRTFFNDSEGYREIEVNGFWLIRWQNKDKWTISIYTQEKMANYKTKVKLFE